MCNILALSTSRFKNGTSIPCARTFYHGHAVANFRFTRAMIPVPRLITARRGDEIGSMTCWHCHRTYRGRRVSMGRHILTQWCCVTSANRFHSSQCLRCWLVNEVKHPGEGYGTSGPVTRQPGPSNVAFNHNFQSQSNLDPTMRLEACLRSALIC